MDRNQPGTAVAVPPNTLAAARASVPGHAIMSNDEIDRVYRLAQALAASKMFKDIAQAEQAFAKILLGRDLGITPVVALSSLDFVRGNLQMRSVLLAAFIRKRPDYDYKIVQHTAELCEIEFRRKFEGEWESMGTSEFTMDDARTAKLIKSDSPWTTAPRNMLFARALSNGVKWFMADVLGGIPVYTEGDSFSELEEPIMGTADEAVSSGAVLPQAVEDVIARASTLGHDGLADRATAEMTVSGQSEAFVADWCVRAHNELDAMEPRDKADPDGLRAQAEDLRQTALIARSNGDTDAADDLDGEADALIAEAEATEVEDATE